ncbi:MAG: branched-chain amino acid ABC transporter permease [Planctomycetota bacterium]|nr:MAG: branched-chain amino acid ABC transporter permease [Planctomycetota bacterium]
MLTQLILNAFISASIYILIAVSFTIIFRVVRFFHFTHAVIFTAGAYFVFFLRMELSFPFLIAVPTAIFASALLGCLIELTIYRSLRAKSTPPLVMLLVSLGIYIVLQNIISIAFGDDTKIIRSNLITEGFNLFGARITFIQGLTICTTIILLLLLVLFLKITRTGKAIRAVSSDPELAAISGIESSRIIIWAFAIGSAICGLAGILLSFDVGMTPTMGLTALMMGLVVAIIGGLANVSGIVLGGLLLGLAQQLGIWKFGAEWQDAIAFGILLGFLIVKPQGILGKNTKKATI